ncbi:MAG: hypothetical protein B7Z73_12045 [Planctomycetia bacterium 21-64-5]|nr:MAG: hypothetical protein B7Z73_12045 [Planctomycetia bacterium 21-64-5]HQU46230.1 hypothetical protein [Pirellulales bacterium]
MLRRTILAALGVALCALPSQADAQLFKRARRDAQRNKCWPAPFLVPDRMAARAPFAVMINNGWRTQNTLGDDHFDPTTGMLNEAGELKVRDILTYSPPEHRTVFVLQSHDEETTAARNQSVNELVSHIRTYAEGPLVAQTNIRPRVAPAEYINTIGTKFNETTPDPRLPAATNTGMGGGGGGGGGAGGGGGF